MQNRCQDSYHTKFNSYEEMWNYHVQLSKDSLWTQCLIKDLEVVPLTKTLPLYHDKNAFAAGISTEAIADTAENLGLAIRVNRKLYPVRETAYKSLLDRAKIGGSALPKLNRETLALTLNACLKLFSSKALVLVRDEKVSAVHSGDEKDYSVLPVDELMEALQYNLDTRFPGNIFERGYSDHNFVCAIWKMPDQANGLLNSYSKMLATQKLSSWASKLVPGVQFVSSDTGVASAKVSALLMVDRYAINIGACIAVDHRHAKTVFNFDTELEQLFAQFGDSVSKLQKLLTVNLAYPVNAMTRVCKKLIMPKKVAIEAIAKFEQSYGGGAASAHAVFIAMQEIPFMLRAENMSQSKLLMIEENMARALSINWEDYDLPKAVEY